MFYCYDNTKIYYRFKKKKNAQTLVLLHGWGANGKSFSMLSYLKRDYQTLEIDFPPFGKSEEAQGWNVFSYANMVISLCQHLKIDKCHILGHSFGGRVAILISAFQKELVDKVVLVDSAGMKPKRKHSYYFKKMEFWLRKRFGLDTSLMGSSDYRSLSPNMKKTFSRIVSTHLEEYASLMKQKTLIIFGKNDKETPVYMAKRLNKLIKNSHLIIIEGCGHFCFQEKPHKFCLKVGQFLRS